MDFHGNIPIWVMISSHVLSGFYVLLFPCNAGNEGVNCVWDGGLGVWLGEIMMNGRINILI